MTLLLKKKHFPRKTNEFNFKVKNDARETDRKA